VNAKRDAILLMCDDTAGAFSAQSRFTILCVVAKLIQGVIRVPPCTQRASGWRRIPAQQNRSNTHSDGDRKGANLIAASKSSASTLLTLLLGREGRVRTNRLTRRSVLSSEHNITVSDQYNLSYGELAERNSKTLHTFSGLVVEVDVAVQLKRACNCYFEPSLCCFSNTSNL